MRKTLMTAGWAFAAIVLLAACHGTNQGETVNVAPDQAPVTAGAGSTATTTTTTDSENEDGATFKAIKSLVITRTENGVKKVHTLNFTFRDDGRLAMVNELDVRGQDDFGGNDMVLDYDDQGRLKSLLQKLVPSKQQPPPQQYKASPQDSFKFTYDSEGRVQTIEEYGTVNNILKLFGTWSFTYAANNTGTERTGIFQYNNPTVPADKSVALFDAKGNLTSFILSSSIAPPNTYFERELFTYTPEGALKSFTEKQYDRGNNFKLVFTNFFDITYKSPGVPEKLTINATDLNNKSYLDIYSAKAYEGDLVTQALLEESLDNGVTFTTMEECSATYQPLKAKPIIDLSVLLNTQRKSIKEFAQGLLIFADQPEFVLGKL